MVRGDCEVLRAIRPFSDFNTHDKAGYRLERTFRFLETVSGKQRMHDAVLRHASFRLEADPFFVAIALASLSIHV